MFNLTVGPPQRKRSRLEHLARFRRRGAAQEFARRARSLITAAPGDPNRPLTTLKIAEAATRP